MKRIIGRKFHDNQTKEYGSFVTPVVNLELLDLNSQFFRFRWANDIIDTLRANGGITYNLLDIGTYNGAMSALAAQKQLTPGDPTSSTINVDSLELHDESFKSAEELAKQVRAKGYKMTVHNIAFEDFKPDKSYDIVIMFECLEHTKDPLSNIEKIYDLLEIGGHLLITVPEENGLFGINDKNPWHYWTSTIQSLVSVLFYDDRKWHIKHVFEKDTLIHIMVQKMSYQS